MARASLDICRRLLSLAPQPMPSRNISNPNGRDEAPKPTCTSQGFCASFGVWVLTSSSGSGDAKELMVHPSISLLWREESPPTYPSPRVLVILLPAFEMKSKEAPQDLVPLSLCPLCLVHHLFLLPVNRSQFIPVTLPWILSSFHSSSRCYSDTAAWKAQFTFLPTPLRTTGSFYFWFLYGLSTPWSVTYSLSEELQE